MLPSRTSNGSTVDSAKSDKEEDERKIYFSARKHINIIKK